MLVCLFLAISWFLLFSRRKVMWALKEVMPGAAGGMVVRRCEGFGQRLEREGGTGERGWE
jgi:hypothetical protein